MSTRPPPQPRPDSRNFTPQPGRCFDVNAAEICWCLDWSRDWPRGWREGTDHHPDCKWDTGTTCTRPDLGRWDNFHARNCGEQCDPWPGVKLPWTRTPEGGMRWPAVGEPEPCARAHVPGGHYEGPSSWGTCDAPPRWHRGDDCSQPAKLHPFDCGQGVRSVEPKTAVVSWWGWGRACTWEPLGALDWQGKSLRYGPPEPCAYGLSRWVDGRMVGRWGRPFCFWADAAEREALSRCAWFSQRNGYGPRAPHPCRPSETCRRRRRRGWGVYPAPLYCSPVQGEQPSTHERLRPPVRSGGRLGTAQAVGFRKMRSSAVMSDSSSIVRRRGHNTPCEAPRDYTGSRRLAPSRVPGVCHPGDGPERVEELRREVERLPGPGERLATWGELAPVMAALGESLAALVACFEVGAWRVLPLGPRFRVRLGFRVPGAPGGEGIAIEGRDTITGQGWAPLVALGLDSRGLVSSFSAWEVLSAWVAQGPGLRELGEALATALDHAHGEAGACWGCPIGTVTEGPCPGCRDQARALGRARFGVEYAPRCVVGGAL